MTRLLTELKTRARLRLNAARRDQHELKLRDCLDQAARNVGFAHWEHGRRVLGGLAVAGDDMGTFWHAPRCNSLLNLWFANYDEARSALASEHGSILLPYRRQYVVAQDDFIQELGLDPADAAWVETQRDLVRAFGTAAWLTLAFERIKAPRSTFAAS